MIESLNEEARDKTRFDTWGIEYDKYRCQVFTEEIINVKLEIICKVKLFFYNIYLCYNK